MFPLIICLGMCVSLELSRRRDYSSDTYKPSSPWEDRGECFCFISIWLFCLNYLISFLCLFYVWLILIFFLIFLYVSCMLSYTGGK